VEVQGRGHGAAVAPREGDAGHRHAEVQLLQGGGGPVDGAAHHPHPGLLPRLRLHTRAPLRQVRQLPDRRHNHRGRGPGALSEAPHSNHREAHRRGRGAQSPRQDRDPPLLRGRRRGGTVREPPREHAGALLQRRGAHGGVAQAEPQRRGSRGVPGQVRPRRRGAHRVHRARGRGREDGIPAETRASRGAS